MFPKGHFDCVYAYEPRNELKLLSVDAHPELSSEVGTVAWTIGDFLLLKPLAPLHTEQESFTLQDEIVSAQGKSLAGVVLSTNGSVMPPLDAAGRLTLKLLRGITHAVARADQYASFQPDFHRSATRQCASSSGIMQGLTFTRAKSCFRLLRWIS